MEYEITSLMNRDILEITISGQGKKDNILEIVFNVIDLVKRSKPRCVLIDIRSIQGKLGVLDAFNLVRNYPSETPRIRAAIVDREENKRQMKFFETVSLNAGYSTQCFTDIDAARDWLSSKR